MNNYYQKVINEIIKSIKKIDSNFYGLDVAGKDKINKKYFERNFCYELYHQMRNNENIKHLFKQDDLIISAEISKESHEIIDEDKIPDFIIHEPGTMNKNSIIIEVKTDIDYKGIAKDFHTLSLFVSKYSYKRGLFILANYSLDDLKNKTCFIINHLNNENKLDKSILDQISIICTKESGEVNKPITLKELLEG